MNMPEKRYEKPEIQDIDGPIEQAFGATPDCLVGTTASSGCSNGPFAGGTSDCTRGGFAVGACTKGTFASQGCTKGTFG
jgi:hypothetical protein